MPLDTDEKDGTLSPAPSTEARSPPNHDLPPYTSPKEWPMQRKWIAISLLSALTFVVPISSSMVATAIQVIGDEFHVTNTSVQFLMLSASQLTYNFAPIFWGPLSEAYGRLPVLFFGNFWFAFFLLAGGFAKTTGQFIAFRFLQGMGGSASVTIAIGVIGDCFTAETRGLAVSIYNLGPNIGIALGPIFGGLVTQYLSWPWMFHILCVFAFALSASCVLILHESFEPVIVARYRKKHGVAPACAGRVPALSSKLRVTMVRPFNMLATQPIVQCMALLYGYLYGLGVLASAVVPTLYQLHYGQSLVISSLHLIAMGLGYVAGGQICAMGMDRVYKRFVKRNPHVDASEPHPEYRLPLLLASSVLVPAGLFWYGWSAEARVFWVVPDLGMFVFAMGTIIGYQCISNYLLDSYGAYAASSQGAVMILRGVAGLTFPLFAQDMFDALGYGWGNSILGLVAVVVGTAVPVFLWTRKTPLGQSVAKWREKHIQR